MRSLLHEATATVRAPRAKDEEDVAAAKEHPEPCPRP